MVGRFALGCLFFWCAVVARTLATSHQSSGISLVGGDEQVGNETPHLAVANVQAATHERHHHAAAPSSSGSSSHEHHHRHDPNAYKNRTRKEKAWVRADRALRRGSHELFHNLNAFFKKIVSEVNSTIEEEFADATKLLSNVSRHSIAPTNSSIPGAVADASAVISGNASRMAASATTPLALLQLDLAEERLEPATALRHQRHHHKRGAHKEKEKLWVRADRIFKSADKVIRNYSQIVLHNVNALIKKVKGDLIEQISADVKASLDTSANATAKASSNATGSITVSSASPVVTRTIRGLNATAA